VASAAVTTATNLFLLPPDALCDRKSRRAAFQVTQPSTAFRLERTLIPPPFVAER
jgi:hypothetical protein